MKETWSLYNRYQSFKQAKHLDIPSVQWQHFVIGTVEKLEDNIATINIITSSHPLANTHNIHIKYTQPLEKDDKVMIYPIHWDTFNGWVGNIQLKNQQESCIVYGNENAKDVYLEMFIVEVNQVKQKSANITYVLYPNLDMFGSWYTEDALVFIRETIQFTEDPPKPGRYFARITYFEDFNDYHTTMIYT